MTDIQEQVTIEFGDTGFRLRAAMDEIEALRRNLADAERRAEEAAVSAVRIWQMYDGLEGVLRSACGGHYGDCDCPGCDWLGHERPPDPPVFEPRSQAG